jgi:hypothetical protein
MCMYIDTVSMKRMGEHLHDVMMIRRNQHTGRAMTIYMHRTYLRPLDIRAYVQYYTRIGGFNGEYPHGLPQVFPRSDFFFGGDWRNFSHHYRGSVKQYLVFTRHGKGATSPGVSSYSSREMRRRLIPPMIASRYGCWAPKRRAVCMYVHTSYICTFMS